jgi:hypothetical protein
MGRVVWRTIPGTGLVSEETPGLRLVVVPTEAPASVRFVVEDQVIGESASMPIVSGYRESVAAAMAAAEEATIRIGGG